MPRTTPSSMPMPGLLTASMSATGAVAAFFFSQKQTKVSDIKVGIILGFTGPTNINDVAVLEFDFVPNSDELSFDFGRI